MNCNTCEDKGELEWCSCQGIGSPSKGPAGSLPHRGEEHRHPAERWACPTCGQPSVRLLKERDEQVKKLEREIEAAQAKLKVQNELVLVRVPMDAANDMWKMVPQEKAHATLGKHLI